VSRTLPAHPHCSGDGCLGEDRTGAIRHVIESQQFDRALIQELFRSADRLRENPGQPLCGKILASLFYEPSTRTRFSFESAMLRLGGSVLTTENAAEFSSAAKGETLEDSIRVTAAYADAIVIRHPTQGAAARAAAASSVPVVNAGDGPGQHPTQALLDLYTIERELGRIDGVTVALAGDLKHGRTVRSLSYLLGKYQNVRVIFVSPPELKICPDILEYLGRHGVAYEETDDLRAAATRCDVLYQTRIQKERFASPEEYARLKDCYRVDAELVAVMKTGAIVMHPLPRVGEIAEEVDALPQAAYFRQAENGLYARMALLEWVLA
jgi:aspartate carbamoyltransferase catalytic subunit